MFRKIFSILIINCSLLIINYSFCQVPPPAPMAIVEELRKELRKNDSIINIIWDKKDYCNTIYSAELMAASSNNGAALLDNTAIDKVVSSLNAFESLGVKGVSICINYPVLVNNYALSSAYLTFYKKVVAEIRKRNLKILINSQESVKDTTLNKLDISSFYQNLTTERFKTEKAQMLQTIIDELQPDYLTIENEPATVLVNTGINVSVDSVASYIKYFLSHISKKQTKLGAGAGSWENIKYFEKFAEESSLDYLDIHYMPVFYNTFLYKAMKMDSIAKKNNKPVIFGKTWLYKANTAEILSDSSYLSVDIIARDVFDNFIPVDSLFISTVFRISNMFKSELTSFSNSQYLFGYVHYIKAVYEYMPPYMILKTGRDLTSLNIEKKQLSVTGLYYKSIIKGLCDTMFMEEPENRNSNLIVFPNPANDEIHIQINPAEENNYCLRICNIYGQVIKSLLKNKLSKGVHNYTFDTGNIAGGIYLIQLQTANLSVSKKVIINK